MKKLLAIVSIMLLIVACNKEEAVEVVPVEEALPAVEEVIPAETAE